MEGPSGRDEHERVIRVRAGDVFLEASSAVPADAVGGVVFASSNASGRHSLRNRFLTRALHEANIATLLCGLLTPEEDEIDRLSAELRYDLRFLTERLVRITDWLAEEDDYRGLRWGYFGAGTSAAVALVASVERRHLVHAIVSRGGRADLAGSYLARVGAATLLIVGSRDVAGLERNHAAYAELQCEKKLEIVPGATDTFDEPGALVEVARLATGWFDAHLSAGHLAERSRLAAYPRP